jgi:hypothetical protein
MPRSARLAFRLLLVLAAAFTATGPAEHPGPAGVPADEAVAAGYPEVRIRKLHLVRPDLIPYPLAYEIVC